MNDSLPNALFSLERQVPPRILVIQQFQQRFDLGKLIPLGQQRFFRTAGKYLNRHSSLVENEWNEPCNVVNQHVQVREDPFGVDASIQACGTKPFSTTLLKEL